MIYFDALFQAMTFVRRILVEMEGLVSMNHSVTPVTVILATRVTTASDVRHSTHVLL